jgi:geranylgeranyl diphosphate synthase type II
MEEINEIIKTEKAKIDDKIQAKIESFQKDSDGSLADIIEACEYSLKAGGKRIRPILTVKVAEMLDGNKNTAYDLGIALEFIHTYSLIHDDLPAMDDDDYRRGQLSNHKVYGEGMAILAGDALLTSAFEILADLDLPSEDKVEIIKLTSRMAGFRGMVGGQSLDLKFEKVDIDFETLKNIHHRKTGALFKASILGGAYCAAPSQKEIEALHNYAQYLGLLFQITDDILDKTGDLKVLGKEVGSDEKSNKSTYVTLLGLEDAKEKAKETAAAAKKELEHFNDNQFLTKLIDFILMRES